MDGTAERQGVWSQTMKRLVDKSQTQCSCKCCKCRQCRFKWVQVGSSRFYGGFMDGIMDASRSWSGRICLGPRAGHGTRCSAVAMSCHVHVCCWYLLIVTYCDNMCQQMSADVTCQPTCDNCGGAGSQSTMINALTSTRWRWTVVRQNPDIRLLMFIDGFCLCSQFMIMMMMMIWRV